MQLTAGQGIALLALGVGGFAVGKAAVDHVLASRGPVTDDLSEFEEQHYRAAGFTKRTQPALDDVVAVGAAVFGIAMVLKGVPELWKQIQGYAP